jgi:hypothetical protein
MPCVSDYLNPSDRERRLQDTARLYEPSKKNS